MSTTRTFCALIVAAGVLAAFTGCGAKSSASTAAASPAPIEVQVQKPVVRDEPIYAEWIGTLDGLVNAQVRAQVTGYLLHQNYAEGAHVKAGDLLFEVDPRPFQALVDQAEANAQKAEADFKRNAELVEKNVVARQDYDNAVAARAQTRAALEQAQLNLEFTKVRAPVDGVAGFATAQIGDLVGPSTGLLTTVSTLDPIKAYFSISEQSYLEFEREPGSGGFPEGLALELILSDGTTYPLKGKFYATDRQIDANTGTLRMAATFPNPKDFLRPGQYARIRAAVRVARNAIEVPQRAVSELQGGYQVAVVGPDNVAHLRPVKVDRRIGTRWIIASGLKADEQVVVEGLQKVREGTAVVPKLATVASVGPTTE